MDPGLRSHGMKADPPGYLWSKYECFLMSGWWDILHSSCLNVKLWSNSTNGTEVRTNEPTNERTNKHTNGWTERRKLYTPRHKCWGYNKQCLLDTPHTVMVNKENYYWGHTKWLTLISSHFAKNIFFGMTLLHAHMLMISVLYVQSIRKLQ